MQFYPKSALSVKLFMFIFNYFYPDKLLYLSGIKKNRAFRPGFHRNMLVSNYARNARRIPAATALPITPATLGPIACINRKFDLSNS